MDIGVNGLSILNSNAHLHAVGELSIHLQFQRFAAHRHAHLRGGILINVNAVLGERIYILRQRTIEARALALAAGVHGGQRAMPVGIVLVAVELGKVAYALGSVLIGNRHVVDTLLYLGLIFLFLGAEIMEPLVELSYTSHDVAILSDIPVVKTRFAADKASHNHYSLTNALKTAAFPNHLLWQPAYSSRLLL